MNKYYVSWGQEQVLLTACYPIQAAVLAARRIMRKNRDDGVYRDSYDETPVVVLSTQIIVSEKGFDSHDDDEKYDASEIIALVMLSARPIKEVENEDDTSTDF